MKKIICFFINHDWRVLSPFGFWLKVSPDTLRDVTCYRCKEERGSWEPLYIKALFGLVKSKAFNNVLYWLAKNGENK